MSILNTVSASVIITATVWNEDEEEAFKWYLKAAEQGHKNAQYENFVSYEQLRDCLCNECDDRNSFKIAMINTAIAKYEAHTKMINDQVTAFWTWCIPLSM